MASVDSVAPKSASTSSRPALLERQSEEIAAKLSSSPNLRLPARLTQDKASEDERQKYLRALLQHDPGVFLERHGQHLSTEQRAYFHPLRNDYEVDFYLKLLEDEDTTSQKTAEEGISSTAKNRRLAKLNRLDKEGYFEEDELRKRAPLLHHQYLGRYSKAKDSQQPEASTMHERLIKQQEEAELQSLMKQQQKQEDAAADAFDATVSESEDEDEEDEAEPQEAYISKTGSVEPDPISTEELEQNREDFQAIMRARFLGGQDGGAEADADASLDEDWAKERTQDAEDRYFES